MKSAHRLGEQPNDRPVGRWQTTVLADRRISRQRSDHRGNLRVDPLRTDRRICAVLQVAIVAERRSWRTPQIRVA